ncbi:hypothetical protein QTO34_004835 [Cnephaeus nilssonii]|uniref:Amine oxidase n=1 Tax=Cnephaeus nilssonii TaxID=3371016 RepID=A0AA40LIY2_CNENI|nr:hypothetical protein QTO34_004835 [Eptesicus nilssonii]
MKAQDWAVEQVWYNGKFYRSPEELAQKYHAGEVDVVVLEDLWLQGQVLVLRTMSTVYNYDYIWDFIFYPNGVMEAKMHATGYVHATFYTPEGLRHGTRLHTHLIGNMHTHLLHYRVDLDVAGTRNSFQTLGMKLENITNPWSPEHQLVQPTLEQMAYPRERQAAFHFRQTLPKYLLFTSPKENCWGHQRSYRLQIHSMAEQVLPPGWQEERAVTWAR